MKTLNKILFITFMAAISFSCGSDDPDYTMYDLSPLRGKEFVGHCIFSTIDVKRDNITADTEVKLVGFAAKESVLTLETTQFDLIEGDILTNFKNTSDNTGYTFDIKGFSFSRSIVPSYINSWYSSSYDEISNARITVAPSSAKYLKANKTLTFSLDADVVFTGKVKASSTTKEEKFKMKYDYSVVMK
ncbi:MAG: hypothetical protein LBU22_01770 [Dysgonamonadaceae bacterium]|jgi:hypothetical protein|nr:hypothetical protein [Dysgonamonadaceae bacterium]